MIKLLNWFLGFFNECRYCGSLKEPKPNQLYTSNINPQSIKEVNDYFKNKKRFIGPIGVDTSSSPDGATLVSGAKDTTFNNIFYSTSIYFIMNGQTYYYDIVKGEFVCTSNVGYFDPNDYNIPEPAGF